MSEAAADFGFVGPAYEAPMGLQDVQRCINWYVEISGVKNSKMPMALLGCPGLNPIAQLTANAPLRGGWVLPGGNQCLWVAGNAVWLMTLAVPATQTTIAQFTTAQVGTLLTNSGPVCIRDNGVVFGGQGGYAVIVDGQFGYYYVMNNAPLTIQFTGGVTNGSSSITVSAIPNGLVAGAAVTVSDSSGFIPGGTLFTGANFNSVTLNMSANATNTNAADTITVTVPVFGQIMDPAFLPASRCAFIEGWLIFNQPFTRTFFTNAATPYTLLFAGSFYALKDSSTDNIVTLFENDRELWLIGEKTTEVWYNAGGQNFSFARIPGIGPQIGCSAAHSISRLGASLVWLAKNEQGENMVIATEQYGWVPISNHGVNHALTSYPLVNDAVGYAYEEEGHLFYMLTFPTADVTWCFDATASRKYGDGVWHQRLSYDPVKGAFHRHRSNCFVNMQDLRLVGDYQTGQVHQMSRQYFSDAGMPLKCQRRTPHVWSREDRKRVTHSRLQVEFTPGVGLQVGQGSNPQAMLRWSDDGGFTWSNEHWTSIGSAGYTKARAAWNRLGWAWDRVYEVNFTDPTQRDIIGASLFGEGEEEAA